LNAFNLLNVRTFSANLSGRATVGQNRSDAPKKNPQKIAVVTDKALYASAPVLAANSCREGLEKPSKKTLKQRAWKAIV
jgi:hypothetical protein